LYFDLILVPAPYPRMNQADSMVLISQSLSHQSAIERAKPWRRWFLL
jgi:hypothetical protein